MSLALAGSACGDSGGDSDPAADAGTNTVEDCRTLLAANESFSLPQSAGTRSFQTHAYFDGEAIWIVNAIVPDGVEAIQIQTLRVGCDGSVVNEPVIVSPDDSFTHTEPRITGYGDKVMVAFATDSGTQPNLSTHYRIFDRREGPGSASNQHLDTQYKAASAGNTWMPELAAGPSGFAVAGLRGVSDFNSFQSFVQRIDTEGTMVGEAVNGELQDGLWQGPANLIMDDAGDVLLAWERNEEDDSIHVVQVRIAAGKSTPETGPVRVSREKSSQVSIGGDSTQGLYLVSSRAAGGLLLKAATDFDPDSAELQLGGDKLVVYPQVAANEGGGLVAWHEVTTGSNAGLHLQAFQKESGALVAAGEQVTIATDNPTIAPYKLSLVHLFDQAYFLTWTEGPVSDLQVKWRFVDMSVAPRN